VRSPALFSPSVPPLVTRFVCSQTGEHEAGGGKLTVPEVLVQASVMGQTGFAIRPGMPFATHRLAATIAHLRKGVGWISPRASGESRICPPQLTRRQGAGFACSGQQRNHQTRIGCTESDCSANQRRANDSVNCGCQRKPARPGVAVMLPAMVRRPRQRFCTWNPQGWGVDCPGCERRWSAEITR
jgi:hypothetical protein